MQYKVQRDKLSIRTLWLSVWNWDKSRIDQFLGEVRVPLSSFDLSSETEDWHQLLQVIIPT